MFLYHLFFLLSYDEIHETSVVRLKCDPKITGTDLYFPRKRLGRREDGGWEERGGRGGDERGETGRVWYKCLFLIIGERDGLFTVKVFMFPLHR